jgi:hypothetical protein
LEILSCPNVGFFAKHHKFGTYFVRKKSYFQGGGALFKAAMMFGLFKPKVYCRGDGRPGKYQS